MVHKSYMEICNTKNFKSMQDKLKGDKFDFPIIYWESFGEAKE